MTPNKKSTSREERLLDLVQRISTTAADHMIAVTEAIGELRSDIDSKMIDLLVASAENKSGCALLNEKLDNIAEETSAAKNAINQLTNEVIELERAGRRDEVAAEDRDTNLSWKWRTRWWQSKEFFLIVIIIMLLIIVANNTGISIVDEIGKLLQTIASVFGKG